ncbi:EthD family reductase [Nocardia farcinica]|uniref:EthD family reductase n=1 Tax=Nocardia farcinica TaxID=37329 RepID=UPI001893B8F7|nr:EthD family reductase [Nocardia farcinica]MBF6255509.1 EthD family reductase [Nocardia farcinica]
MSYQISVCYGAPDDPAAFDEYYRTTHVPLAAKVPGLAGLSWGKCRSLDGSEPQFYAVAQLRFATEADLQQALASPEMKAAGKDVRNFATGGASMFVQQLESPLS